jgi:hypothetical protein
MPFVVAKASNKQDIAPFSRKEMAEQVIGDLVLARSPTLLFSERAMQSELQLDGRSWWDHL